MLKTLDLRIKEAVDGEISHTDFLFRICCDEVERRETSVFDGEEEGAPPSQTPDEPNPGNLNPNPPPPKVRER
jgi:hypothetical protein